MTTTAYMKITVAAVILFTSVTTSFAGNFTPIPKVRVVQAACSAACQLAFQACLQVCGTGCQSLRADRPRITRNCDFELDACQRGLLSYKKKGCPGKAALSPKKTLFGGWGDGAGGKRATLSTRKRSGPLEKLAKERNKPKKKSRRHFPVIPVGAALSVHCRGRELVISPTKHS